MAKPNPQETLIDQFLNQHEQARNLAIDSLHTALRELGDKVKEINSIQENLLKGLEEPDPEKEAEIKELGENLKNVYRDRALRYIHGLMPLRTTDEQKVIELELADTVFQYGRGLNKQINKIRDKFEDQNDMRFSLHSDTLIDVIALAMEGSDVERLLAESFFGALLREDADVSFFKNSDRQALIERLRDQLEISIENKILEKLDPDSEEEAHLERWLLAFNVFALEANIAISFWFEMIVDTSDPENLSKELDTAEVSILDDEEEDQEEDQEEEENDDDSSESDDAFAAIDNHRKFTQAQLNLAAPYETLMLGMAMMVSIGF